MTCSWVYFCACLLQGRGKRCRVRWGRKVVSCPRGPVSPSSAAQTPTHLSPRCCSGPEHNLAECDNGIALWPPRPTDGWAPPGERAAARPLENTEEAADAARRCAQRTRSFCLNLSEVSFSCSFFSLLLVSSSRGSESDGARAAASGESRQHARSSGRGVGDCDSADVRPTDRRDGRSSK